MKNFVLCVGGLLLAAGQGFGQYFYPSSAPTYSSRSYSSPTYFYPSSYSSRSHSSPTYFYPSQSGLAGHIAQGMNAAFNFGGSTAAHNYQFPSYGYQVPNYSSPVHVNGYYRGNGSYVNSHYRTRPDSTIYNNWSHSGNVNPYTGQVGHKRHR